MKQGNEFTFSIIFILSSLLSLSAGSKFQSKTLNNGLEVIVIEDHIVPLVTIEIAVKNGAFVETPEYDGLAHLYEHMFFKANQKIPNQEAFLERTRELGMSWNGTTQEERVNYYFTMPVDSLRAGLEFMKNAVRFPLFNQEELERERPVVIGEYDRTESNPYYHIDRAIKKKLWYKHYSRKNSIGDREIILSATREKMQEIKERYYIPNNSALLLSGDITPEQGYALAEEFFGDWEAGENPFEKWPVPNHPALEKSEVVVVQKPVNISVISFWQHGPKAGEDLKDTFAADVLIYILLQDNSKFQKNLIDSGIGLEATIFYYTQNNTGPITARIVCTPDKVLQARDALWAEIQKLTEPDYYTDEQLETAKTKLEVEELFNREKTSSWSHTVSFWWSVTGLDYYRNYIKNLRQVSRADINNYVNKYIKNKPMIMGVILPEETYGELNMKDEEFLP